MSGATDKATQVQETPRTTCAKRAIEESFPIVEINGLAVPETRSFKPIYQMHKWFARRASCVFRAILLGALKPAGTDIMQEFYKDHTNDSDTNGKVILDPFMGGGTTVVEALRLSSRVIGVDLNPVAWFISKTEVQPVDVDQLEAEFERFADRQTTSGRTLRDELLGYYKTECPACGNLNADIIYVFWVKSAICTNPEHLNEQVPLFSDYLVAQKMPSIRFFPDAQCPNRACGKTFDWEIEPGSLVGDPRLMVASPSDGAGEGRANRRWAYSQASHVASCPWCSENGIPKTQKAKPQRKKVRLSVLYCPHCATIFQYRGTPPDELKCPGCSKSFHWQRANVPDKGEFQCPKGHRDEIIESIRRLPESQVLPARMYAIEGFCRDCAANGWEDENDEENGQDVLIASQTRLPVRAKSQSSRNSSGWLSKNNGKFFKSVSPNDERRYQEACETWELQKDGLPYPKQMIPVGEKTKSGLISHHYRYWHQIFNPRQLLCLSTLGSVIAQMQDKILREMLLTAFLSTLEPNNTFTRNIKSRKTPGGTAPGGIFSRHDYQPKATYCEQNVWGVASGNRTFQNSLAKVLEGKKYNAAPFDRRIADGRQQEVRSKEVVDPRGVIELACRSSSALAIAETADAVITDPPYAGNVNYSELSDFFYVWLRLFLVNDYPQFAPELTPKADEIIENKTRGKTLDDFRLGLSSVFNECRLASRPSALLVFTFHHSDESAWEALLQAVCEAGWTVDSVYPIHGDSESTMNLLSGSNISYDLIHVCEKRNDNSVSEKRAWATIKVELRREARREIERIERDVYGNNRSISAADKLIILTGKCLQLYSRHYNAVVDHTGRIVPLREALEDIRMVVDQLISKERPLPGELEDIDRPSYVYLTALSEKKEIKSDEVHKATRAMIEVDELIEAGLMKRGRTGRGRTFEVKMPIERFPALLEKFKEQPIQQPGLFADSSAGVPEASGTLFIDRLHFLMGLAEGGENLRPWIERWRGEIPQIRAAAEYLMKLRKDFAPALKKILGMIEVGPLRFE